MNPIKEWWFKRKLKSHKERVLVEVGQDLKYIETFKSDILNYDEDKARKRMAELKAIPERSDVEEQELDAVLDTIAQSKGIKNEYEKSMRLADDLEKYISLI